MNKHRDLYLDQI